MDYRSSKRGHSVDVQLAIVGPVGADRNDVEEALTEKVTTGRDPAGWKVRIVEWRGKEIEPERQRDFFYALQNFAGNSNVDTASGHPISARDVRDRFSEGDEEE